jgi:hypothetical protein
MIATFIETTGFTKSIADLLPDQGHGRLQQVLLKYPGAGAAIPGCGRFVVPIPSGARVSAAVLE